MNWLTRAGRRLSPGRTATAAPWGDGLVDEGFDLLSGASDWTDVSHEELVFLSPGLHASGLPGAAARQRLLPLLAAARARRNAGLPGDAPVLAAHALAWLSSCTASVEGGQPCPPARLLDAMALSWETQANAAYWLPAFEPMQESLAAAAWLGVSCSGRPALLPRVLADVLASVTADPGDPGEWGLAAAYLAYRIRAAGLSQGLGRALAAIAAGAEVVLVKPGRAPSRTPVLPPGLGEALASSAPQSSPTALRSTRPGRA